MTGVVFPLILNRMLDTIGLQWTLRIWAIAIAIFSAIALLGVKSRLPVPRYNAVNRRPKLIPNKLEFLGTPLFWTFVCHNFTFYMTISAHFFGLFY